MNREKLDSWCERGILGLGLTVLVFSPLALGAVLPWQFLVVQGLVLSMLALWVVRLWASPRPQMLWPPICWAVLAFTVYGVVRYLQSDIEYVAREELIRILVYAGFFFIVLNNLHRQESIQTITLGLVFLGMAISAYAVFQFVTKSDKVWNQVSVYKGRAGGTFYNPNQLAAFLEMVVPLGFCYVLTGRLSHVAKIFVGYASVAMIAGVAVTLSRGGLMVTGVELAALCVVLLFQRNYRIQAMVLLVALCGLVFFAAPKMEAMRLRFQHLPTGENLEDMRLWIWRSALRMWEDHFWLGVGPGQFDNWYRPYRTVTMQMSPEFVHNDYLNTLADYGVAGAVLVAAACVLLYGGVARTWKFVRIAPDDFARKKSSKFAFLLGGSLGVFAVMLHSAVDFPMHIPANALLAITLMALLSSQRRFATDRYWFTAGPWTKCVATGVILAAAGCFGYAGWRGAAECRYLFQASAQRNYSQAQIEKLKRAWAVEPGNSETAYAIAECYRIKSLTGSAEYMDFARQAMEWYRRGMTLNPHDGYNWLGYGRCLDWINSPDTGGQEDSWPYYQRAYELDPNGCFTSEWIGWHFVQTGDYAAARTWLIRSRRLLSNGNDIADNYLPIIEQRLREAAAARVVGQNVDQKLLQ